MAKIMNKIIPTHPAHLGFLPVFTTKMARHAPTKTQAPGGAGAPGSLATASEDTSLRVLNVSGRQTAPGSGGESHVFFSRW